MEVDKKITYPIGEEMKGKSLVGYIKECYENKKYIECISMINWTIELCLKTLIKNKQINTFIGGNITPLNNPELCRDTTKKINNQTLGNCFYICFWFGLIDLNLYGKIKSHLDRRNDFTHSLESILKMDLREIELYYQEGIYIINKLDGILYNLNYPK